jgi:hypothetical protein
VNTVNKLRLTASFGQEIRLIFILLKAKERFAVLLGQRFKFCGNIFRNNYYYFQKQFESKNWKQENTYVG